MTARLDESSKSEQVAFEMFREAARALVGVTRGYLRRQHAGLKTFNTEEANAAAKMVGIWTELGHFYLRRVREEFPHIRDHQDVARLIDEMRGTTDD